MAYRWGANDKWNYLLLASDVPLNQDTDVDIVKQNETVSPITVGMHVPVSVNGFGQTED
jgi:hypothetical protein